MSQPPLTPHDRASILQKGRRIAADFADEACDPTSGLRMVDRLALATLALAVDVEASRLAGVEPMTAVTRAQLADALARLERMQPTSLRSTGPPRRPTVGGGRT